MRYISALLGIIACIGPTLSAQTKPTLPQYQVNTDLSNSPVTGKSIAVSAGQDLQAAINSANPGDEIVLQAGATWHGSYTLPNKGQTTSWITIRSSAVGSLPGPGTRVSPTDAANMPTIMAPGSVVAFYLAPQANHYRLIGLEITETPKEPINYGLIMGGDPNDTNAADLPSYITVDRCYIHGQVLGHIKFGWQLNGSYLALIDSYVTEFHGLGQDTQAITGYMGTGPFKISNNFLEGAGENIIFGGAYDAIPNTTAADVTFTGNYLYKPDTWRTNSIVPPPSNVQAQGSTGGSLTAGTYYYAVIALGTVGTLNTLPGQAQSARSSEVAVNVAAGQSAVSLQWNESTYGDSQDTRLADNYVIARTKDAPGSSTRNWAYMGTTPSAGATTISYIDKGSSSLTGFGEWARYWLVKNLFEIKNGTRWLVDGNVFENNWVNAQNGFSILFTPRNESPFMAGNKITDITFRNNIVRHVAGGINVGSEDDTAPASYASQQIPTARLYFYNNLFEDVNWNYNGNGIFFEAGEGAFSGQSGAQDIILDHNTVFQNGNFADLGNCCGNQMQNLTFTNNVFGEGSYGWYVNGLGQSYSAITQVVTGLTFSHNVWAGDPGPYQVSGNSFPSDFSQVAFVNYNGGSGGDYHLSSTSLYKGTASDGTDPGANMDTLNAMLQVAVSGKSDSSSSSSGSSAGSGASTPTPSAPASTASTSPSPTLWFEIANRNSGKCLTVQSNNTLAQYSCSPTNTAQMFSLVPSYDSNNSLLGYQVHSRAVDASMNVWGASTANGATIGLYPPTNTPNELFALNADQHGSFTVVAKHSGSCFDIGGLSTADGTPLEQWICNGGANQAFALVLTAVQ